MRELALKMMLRNFVLQHPSCEERHAGQICAVERRSEKWSDRKEAL
jgi:hypothetical protein